MTLRAERRRRERPALRCGDYYERVALKIGHRWIAGLDEAGRGCLFGPVFAAAVILSPERPIPGLDDSKRLSADRRVELAVLVRERAVAWAVASAEASEIDRINILEASRLAMRRALARLSVPPDYLLVDALRLDAGIDERALIHGDARCQSIAAASILAKVDRDALMEDYHSRYPVYGLARHKGYGTPEHLRALVEYGPTPEHRHSFAPVRQHGAQIPMFRTAAPCQ